MLIKSSPALQRCVRLERVPYKRRNEIDSKPGRPMTKPKKKTFNYFFFFFFFCCSWKRLLRALQYATRGANENKNKTQKQVKRWVTWNMFQSKWNSPFNVYNQCRETIVPALWQQSAEKRNWQIKSTTFEHVLSSLLSNIRTPFSNEHKYSLVVWPRRSLPRWSTERNNRREWVRERERERERIHLLKITH